MTTPFASGREADIFALDDERVLRRYRREADTTAEAATMKNLDTGLSALILAQVAVDDTDPMAAVASDFLNALLPLLPGDPARLLSQVVEFRVGQRAMSPGETGSLDRAAARVRGER